jgi:hypothetical protein
MPETYPAQVSTFKVIGRLVRGVIDSSDVDQEPDVVPIPGAVVKFTPSLNPPVFRVPSATIPLTVFQETVVATTDADGYLIAAGDSAKGVVLAYGFSPSILPTGWTWNVNISVGGSFPDRTFAITGSANGIVDLANVIPVGANAGSELVSWLSVVNQVTAARDEAIAAKNTLINLLVEDPANPGLTTLSFS